MDPPIFQAAILGTPMVLAWGAWKVDCGDLRLYRRLMSAIGLLIGSVAVIGHVALVTHIRRIGGIAADWSLLDWARLLALLTFLAIPLSLFGRGKTRWFSASSPALLSVLLLISFWVL